MSKLTTLITAAGVVTQANANYCDQYIMIGDIDTACPIKGLNVEVGGKAVINIQESQPLCSAFSKWLSGFCATLVGLCFKVATGRINKATTIRFVNNGVTTPDIFTFSEAGNGKPIQAISEGINALGNQTFEKFSALMITPSANLGNLDFIFNDGSLPVTMTAAEADALFAMNNPTEANGRLDAVVTTIDNTSGKIKSVRVNATTAVTVLVINFDDGDFRALKAKA